MNSGTEMTPIDEHGDDPVVERAAHMAAVMPSVSATGTENRVVTAASLSVLTSRPPISSATGMLLA